MSNYGSVPTDEGGDAAAVQKTRHGIELPDDSRPTCRNPLFALLFVVHLVGVGLLGSKYGTFAVADEIELHLEVGSNLAENALDLDLDDDDEMGEFLRGVILRVALPCAVLSFVLSYGTAAFVLPWSAGGLVRICLLLSFGLTAGVCGLFSYRYRVWYVYAISAILSLLALVYTCKIWHVVPFATANLKVAIRGMTENAGTYLIALVFSALSFVWGVGWFYVANGVYELKEVYGTHGLCDDEDAMKNATLYNGLDCEQTEQEAKEFGGIMFALLVSLFWTLAVILNTVKVTVAGVMATWCFDKEDADGCCSPAVASSLCRSLTYSLGSICFGSLIEGVASAIHAAASYAKKVADSDGSTDDCNSRVASAIVCLTKCFDDVVEYFNTWAYVYVGVYGYGYVTSGKKVMKLLKERGWASIASNFLVSYVLGFNSIIVALITGAVAIALDNDSVGIEGYWDSFAVGLVVGFFISHVMMNVINGAVNTAIVCFADQPDRMIQQHPAMMKEMAEAWLKVYPDCGVQVPSGMYDVVV